MNINGKSFVWVTMRDLESGIRVSICTSTYTYTHIHVYIYIYVCVCVTA